MVALSVMGETAIAQLLEYKAADNTTALFLHPLDGRAESGFLKFVCQIYFNIAFTLFCTSL